MSNAYYIGVEAQVERGHLAVIARWQAEEQRLNLDVILGNPEDCSTYVDCIEGAKREGATMTAAQREQALALSRNPK